MNCFIKAVRAEMLKQHKVYFHSRIIYISLFIWPLLSFISSYYSFKPFNLGKSTVPYLNEKNLLIFILLGYICMSFFRSLVQSAWNFSFERMNGTFELIYLSPASRMAVILGNALSSLFESVWVMFVFTVSMLFLNKQNLQIDIPAALVTISLMIVLAVLWGMLLNALFMFSRDSAFLFTVLEEPMEIFSGVKVPTGIFPIWAKAISLVFPLTYALEAIRKVFLGGCSLSDISGLLLIGVLLIVLMFIIINICLTLGERHAKVTGNMTLF